ncbi:unnamed protein product, partial [Brassica oleracea var. botrytis]
KVRIEEEKTKSERGEKSNSPSGFSPTTALTLDPQSLFSSGDWGFLYLRSPHRSSAVPPAFPLSFSFSTLSFLLSSLDFRVSSDLIKDTCVCCLSGEPTRSDLASAGEDGGASLPLPTSLVYGLYLCISGFQLVSSSIDNCHGVQQQRFGGSSPHFRTLFVYGYLTSSYFGVPEPLLAASVEAVGSHFRVRVRATEQKKRKDYKKIIRVTLVKKHEAVAAEKEAEIGVTLNLALILLFNELSILLRKIKGYKYSEMMGVVGK